MTHYPIKADSTRARLLRAACLEPLTAMQLLDRADRREVLDATFKGAQQACTRLAARGLLRVTREAVQRGPDTIPALYVLTPAGEDALDALYQGAAHD